MRPFLPLAAVAILAGCVAAPPATDASTGPGAEGDARGRATGLELVASIAFPTGAFANDLAMRDGYAYLSTLGAGSVIIDVRQPEAPLVVGMVECGGIDVGVHDAPDGRRVMTLSSSGPDGCPDASSTGGVRLVDVTRPDDPLVLGQVPLPEGSHTHTTWGDSGIVYSSEPRQRVSPGGVEILDLRDPDHPRLADVWTFPAASPSPGCHDILAEPHRHRAFCAGGTEVLVWEIKDPLRPEYLASFRQPMVTFHHSVAVTSDGRLLVLSDETAGSYAPACAAPAPPGALWAYDVEDHRAPRALGSFALPPAPGTCTAHNGEFLPGTRTLAIAFFSGGTLLVDFEDPSRPVLLDQEAPPLANAWSSYPLGNHVLVGDRARGFDVLRLVREA